MDEEEARELLEPEGSPTRGVQAPWTGTTSARHQPDQPTRPTNQPLRKLGPVSIFFFFIFSVMWWNFPLALKFHVFLIFNYLFSLCQVFQCLWLIFEVLAMWYIYFFLSFISYFKLLQRRRIRIGVCRRLGQPTNHLKKPVSIFPHFLFGNIENVSF